jgi:nitric oxide reductase NorQ protein
MLSNDPRIRPGIPCLVKVLKVTKPQRTDRGVVEVEFVRHLNFQLEGVYLDPFTSLQLQVLLESGQNILLDGPQGCGKTVLTRTIAEALGFEFVFFNCSAVIEATDFLATLQVRDSGSGTPITGFTPTDFLRALELAADSPDKRFLVFFDEFNRCQESARNALMPALDSTRKIFNPIANAFIDIADNIQFIAAVNRGSAFTGVYGIDPAQLDRFAPVRMTYLPPSEEIKLLAKRYPSLAQASIKAVVEIASTIRKSEELSSGLSVRATEEACLYLQHDLVANSKGRYLPDVLKAAFAGRFNGDPGDPSSDAGIVTNLINQALRQNEKTKSRKS